MAIKSLIELQKGNLNYTPYANYYDVSNRYNVPQSLSEYILTNYTLGWGNGSARYLSYSNSELDCSYAEQDDITLIPIQRSTITKLAVKFMCTGLNSQWGIFDICLVRFDGNTQINSDRKFFVLDGHIADQSSSNINQWYNYEFDFDNFEADYIGFATGVVGWKLDDFAFYISENANGGGAGSGYIGNLLVSNKKMVGYNVPTSSAEATKTESVNEVSASAVSGKPKSGNGFAKIKFLRELIILKLETYGTTIYGQFNILDGNPQNKTVVAKANSVPASINDGIAFSLSSYTGNPFRMTGFSSNTHYYFVIFATNNGVSTKISEVADITTPSSVSVLMDSDSSYIDSDMLVYSRVNQSTLYQNWYHYDSSNVYYYKNNYYNSGHSYLIFDNVINTGSYKYICVDAEIFDGSIPSAADQHWNYLAGAIVLASDGTPVCVTTWDEVTNAHKTVYMARWDTFIPANNKDWLTTGKLPRYMFKIPINDIPNTDIRLVVFSCDAKNRVYGVLLEG